MLRSVLFGTVVWISQVLAATFTETTTITISACSAITTPSSGLSSTALTIETTVSSILPSSISTESIILSGNLPSVTPGVSSVVSSSENLAPALISTSPISSSTPERSVNPTISAAPTTELSPAETESITTINEGPTTITASLSQLTSLAPSRGSNSSFILGSSEANFHETSALSSLTSTTIVEVSSIPSSQNSP
ncbi:hypothetical protein OnM2_043005 [Erysiphe neolycopersici]|uniref:Uncharacterized protein n=1 Tax=Erysiphe neolycopersici TaxID=212602 RepID=A0A420HUZ4_9PEZI|nr:hypothetical protein OnM2_043005 [Erysiphe neolycopersici]